MVISRGSREPAVPRTEIDDDDEIHIGRHAADDRVVTP
jgi:hypothetical protein